MSYRKEMLEYIPYIPPLALHCFCVDITGAHRHLGVPSFHLERVHRLPHYSPCAGAASVCEHSPALIRKRNERERQRVRCVNEGYARLRERLPCAQLDDKRLSKVETLRAAIEYIKHLQGILDVNGKALEAGHKRPKCQ